MPDVPTIAESGYPGYEALNWYGFLAPRGIQKDVVERLNKEIVKALAHPQVVAALHKTGTEPKSSTPDEVRRLHQARVRHLGQGGEGSGY